MKQKYSKKYLKHIIKENFGNIGLRRLKITEFCDGKFMYSNIYYFHGFYIRIFVSNLDGNIEANVFIYNYWYDHSWLKDKTETSISKIIYYKNKWLKGESYNYFKSESDFDLQDKYYVIKYSKEIVPKFYDFIDYCKNNLYCLRDNGNGYKHVYDEIEILYDKNYDIIFRQMDVTIKIENFIKWINKKEELISKINHIRKLNLNINFEII
jgi:hypothetical protein